MNLLHKDVMFLESGGLLLLLRDTKTGRSLSSMESVPVNDVGLCKALKRICQHLDPETNVFTSDYAQVASFTTRLGVFFGLVDPRLTSHTYRRGGASYYFQACGSYDPTQQQGRWAQLKTARQYIDGALADLSQSKLPDWGRKRIDLACRALPAALAQLAP